MAAWGRVCVRYDQKARRKAGRTRGQRARRARHCDAVVTLALPAMIGAMIDGGAAALIIVGSHRCWRTGAAEQLSELMRLTGHSDADAHQKNCKQERRHHGEAAQAGQSEHGSGHRDQRSEEACCYTISLRSASRIARKSSGTGIGRNALTLAPPVLPIGTQRRENSSAATTRVL